MLRITDNYVFPEIRSTMLMMLSFTIASNKVVFVGRCSGRISLDCRRTGNGGFSIRQVLIATIEWKTLKP